MVELKEVESKKRDELYHKIVQKGFSIEEAKRIFAYLEDECVIEITSPKMEESELQAIRIQAGRTGRFQGKSYKPGNIYINIKASVNNFLASGFSAIASIGAISMSQPLIAVFTILAAVLSAANLCKIDLDETAVMILAVLWEGRITNDSIDSDTALEHVNTYLESNGREAVSNMQYNDLLADLDTIGCISLNNGKIKLIERIHIKY